MLLAKPQGGFRPAAWLPSLFGLYAKLRVQHLRELIAANSRPCLALGTREYTLGIGDMAMMCAEAYARH
eukprot:288380-Pyramimonas_sp.AAC.1